MRPHVIEGKKIRDCSLKVEMGDYFVLMSDGVVHAGVGNLMSFGWGLDKGQRVYPESLQADRRFPHRDLCL